MQNVVFLEIFFYVHIFAKTFSHNKTIISVTVVHFNLFWKFNSETWDMRRVCSPCYTHKHILTHRHTLQMRWTGIRLKKQKNNSFNVSDVNVQAQPQNAFSIYSPTVLDLSPFDSVTPWRHTLSRGAALVFLSVKTPLWPLTWRCQCPGSTHDLCPHCLTLGHTVPFPVPLKKPGGHTAQMAGAELMKVTHQKWKS